MMKVIFFCSIVVALSVNHSIRGEERVLVFAGGEQDSLPAPALQAKLREPFGAEYDPSGNLWIVEMISGNRLLVLKPDGNVHFVAGKIEAGFAGDGKGASEVQMNGPHNLAISTEGQILIADTWNGRIRRWDPQTQRMTSLPAFQVDFDRARKSGPYCVSVTPDGNDILVSDLLQVHRIRMSTGERSLVAGNGEKGVPVDGELASASPLVDPRAAVQDRKGNVYVLERSGNALRVISSNGKIRTVVNLSGKKGITLSMTHSKDAMLSGPKHLCVDHQDRVLIADAENHMVVRYSPSEDLVVPVAGTGQNGAAGVGGHPLKCQLNRPHGVTVHPATGRVLITDTYNNRILTIEP